MSMTIQQSFAPGAKSANTTQFPVASTFTDRLWPPVEATVVEYDKPVPIC
jgi:hypothetical protein